jgi:hypothetical protein
MHELQPTGALLIVIYENTNGADRSDEVCEDILVKGFYSQGTVHWAPEFIDL